MKLGEYLAEKGIAFQSFEHPPAYTAQEVAAEEHVSGNLIAKAVVVHANGKYALCALPASYKLDMAKVAKALKAQTVRLADEGEMAELFPDMEVGAEPPMGQLWNLPTLVDRHLAEDDEIVFQAGTHRNAIRMRYSDYEALTKPKVADLAVHL
jgi:Ala-tRNA(Pro) deacylase